MFLAVLITGGFGGVRSAEIFLRSTNTFCSLPDLPEWRVIHTQDGPWACGGLGNPQRRFPDTRTSCAKWSDGSWISGYSSWGEYYMRVGHVSWATASGVYLMGGMGNMENSELVKEDGSVTEGFNLKYQTK